MEFEVDRITIAIDEDYAEFDGGYSETTLKNYWFFLTKKKLPFLSVLLNHPHTLLKLVTIINPTVSTTYTP